jgi:hypothetical protein
VVALSRTAHPHVAERVTTHIAILKSALQKQKDLEEQRQREKKLQYLDQQVPQLLKLLPGSATGYQEIHRHALTELATLASQGSRAAVAAVAPYMKLPWEERQRLGLTVPRFMESVPLTELSPVFVATSMSHYEMNLVTVRLREDDAPYFLRHSNYVPALNGSSIDELVALRKIASTRTIQQAIVASLTSKYLGEIKRLNHLAHSSTQSGSFAQIRNKFAEIAADTSLVQESINSLPGGTLTQQTLDSLDREIEAFYNAWGSGYQQFLDRQRLYWLDNPYLCDARWNEHSAK